jgi:hypothetical protein
MFDDRFDIFRLPAGRGIAQEDASGAEVEVNAMTGQFRRGGMIHYECEYMVPKPKSWQKKKENQEKVKNLLDDFIKAIIEASSREPGEIAFH